MPERVLAQLPQGVVLVDQKLLIDYANPAAERLLGAGSPGESLPEPWPDFSLRELAERLFEPDPPTGGRLVESDHQFFWVEGLPPTATETAILIVEDVTERERARRSEREFVENAAHELRTPLAAIVSVMDVLEGGAKDIPEARDRFLKHIRVHSERLSRRRRSPAASTLPTGWQSRFGRQSRPEHSPIAISCTERSRMQPRTRPSTHRGAKSSSKPERTGRRPRSKSATPDRE